MWWIVLCVAAAAAAFAVWAYYQTTAADVTSYTVRSSRIPQGFDGVKIVHLSDLQNCRYGVGFYRRIFELIEREAPDYIVFTGDIIDRRKYNLDNAKAFVFELTKRFNVPVYYVTGNHEAWCGRYDEVRNMLQNHGVIVLDDKSVMLSRENDVLRLIGIDDPGFISREKLSENERNMLQNKLKSLLGEEYSILLTHRPELLPMYAKCNIDLALCGHAHGGQFRLPLIGALYAPDQGLLPKLTKGEHKKQNTTEIISRGLGSGLLQFRTFNRPEVVAVTLKTE